MKEMIAISMGYMNESRVRPGTRFSVPDDWEATWAKPAEDVKAPAEHTTRRRQHTLRDLEEAKPKRGADMGKPEDE